MKIKYLFTLSTLCFLLPLSAPGATNVPHGIYELAGDAFTNPVVTGYKAEILWAQSNTARDVYDWTKIEKLVVQALAAHKQLGVSLRILSSVPAWVTSLSGVTTYHTRLGPDPMVMPFDPIVEPLIVAYIQEFCRHFDGQLTFVTMGGLGYKTETYMPLPSQIGLDMSIEDYSVAYFGSSDLFIDTYASNLFSTPFVLAAAVPFDDFTATDLITGIINYGLPYPLFGVVQWGLKATSTSDFFINGIILQNDAGRATGFQLIGASDGSIGGDLQGSLAQALYAGKAMGADWLEIYPADAMNTRFANMLKFYNTLLH